MLVPYAYRDSTMICIAGVIVAITIVCQDNWCVLYTGAIFLALLSVYAYVADAERQDRRWETESLMTWVIVGLLANVYSSKDDKIMLYTLYVLECVVMMEAAFCSPYSILSR